MFEYVKTILSKVSFDKELFSRELKKALNQLDADESAQLKQWVMHNYKHHSVGLNSVEIKTKAIN